MKELAHEKATNLKLNDYLWVVNNIDILHQIKTIGFNHPFSVQFNLLDVTHEDLFKPFIRFFWLNLHR